MSEKCFFDAILFNPSPHESFQSDRRVELPLNLLHPATTLVNAGFRVKVIDQSADPGWKGELEAALVKRPLCFGISCMTGPQIIRAIAVCKQVKSIYPDVPVVWGGIHASILPVQTLKNPYVDIIVIGEGEQTLLELVKAFANKESISAVKGIVFKSNHESYFTAQRKFIDLDSQPPLRYELIDINLYRQRIFGADHIGFNSSRGCVFRCGFCYGQVVNKRFWRTMQPKTVIEHLRRIINDYGINGFNFTDDNLFVDMDNARALMEEVVRSKLNIRLGKLHIRIDQLLKMDDELLRLMVRAGVERFTIGVESGNQRILDLIKKDITVSQIIKVSSRLKEYPVTLVYLFMMGLPTETPDELSDSLRLSRQLLKDNSRANTNFNIYMPFPGTELYRLAVDQGLKEPNSLEEWASFNWKHLSEESPWIVPETRSLISGLELPIILTSGKHRYKKANRIVKTLSALYQPLGRYRINNLNVQFPIEARLLRTLRLFGRQN